MNGIRRSACSVIAVVLLALGAPVRAQAQAQDAIGSGQVRVAGMQLAVGPASQTVPRGQETGLNTYLVDAADPNSPLPCADTAGLVVKGELTGAGFLAPEALSAPLGQLLAIPPPAKSGSYRVENLRLEDAAGNFLMAAEPSVATLDVIDRVIVTSVRSRPLSLDEIRDRGIVIGDKNYTAYEFTFGIGTKSDQVPVKFDVAFNQDASDDPSSGGGLNLRPSLPGLAVPNLEVKGLKLEPASIGFEGVEIPPIPAVVVVPGNIAFLHQYFQVLVLVSNVAPPGSRLVVTGATAELELPAGDDLTQGDPPLAPADLPTGPYPLDVDLANTATGGADFGPGEDAQGEFLVEGRKEGTHRLRVQIQAELQGLPVGTVPLSGSALGTVLVRNPSFALTFHHPAVVRAGETYSLFVTVHNTSGSQDDTDGVTANLVKLTLDPRQTSGATLIADSDPNEPLGTVTIEKIEAQDSATVEYRLIARKNGRTGRYGRQLQRDATTGRSSPVADSAAHRVPAVHFGISGSTSRVGRVGPISDVAQRRHGCQTGLSDFSSTSESPPSPPRPGGEGGCGPGRRRRSSPTGRR